MDKLLLLNRAIERTLDASESLLYADDIKYKDIISELQNLNLKLMKEVRKIKNTL